MWERLPNCSLTIEIWIYLPRTYYLPTSLPHLIYDPVILLIHVIFTTQLIYNFMNSRQGFVENFALFGWYLTLFGMILRKISNFKGTVGEILPLPCNVTSVTVYSWDWTGTRNQIPAEWLVSFKEEIFQTSPWVKAWQKKSENLATQIICLSVQVKDGKLNTEGAVTLLGKYLFWKYFDILYFISVAEGEGWAS